MKKCLPIVITDTIEVKLRLYGVILTDLSLPIIAAYGLEDKCPNNYVPTLLSHPAQV